MADMSQPARRKKKLGEVLLELGLINEDQLKTALESARMWNVKLGRSLVANNFISEQKLKDVLSNQLGLPSVDLDKILVTESLLRLIPKELIVKHHVFPIGIHREGARTILKVAMGDPLDAEAIRELEFGTGNKIQPVLAEEKQVKRIIRRFYLKGEMEISEEVSPDKEFEIMRDFFPTNNAIIDEQTKPRAESESDSPARDISDEALEKILICRSRLEALTALLIKKGVISREEFEREVVNAFKS